MQDHCSYTSSISSTKFVPQSYLDILNQIPSKSCQYVHDLIMSKFAGKLVQVVLNHFPRRFCQYWFNYLVHYDKNWFKMFWTNFTGDFLSILIKYLGSMTKSSVKLVQNVLNHFYRRLWQYWLSIYISRTFWTNFKGDFFCEYWLSI